MEMNGVPQPPDLSGGLSCPVPLNACAHVLLAHGGGGKLTQQLIQSVFLPHFTNPLLSPLHDGAVVTLNGVRCAFTTDAYVVHPIEFPGGDIGDLAVNGTVNDLAMCGARPLFLSAAFVIEEGMAMEELRRIAASMHAAAARAGVLLVTGDTKVVDRGKGDKVFITTSGLGIVREHVTIAPGRAAPGDVLLLSGPVGMHGIAILSVREGLEFSGPVMSDTAPLADLVSTMLDVCPDIHVLRDPTRGGVASTLNEIATSAGVGMEIDETAVPVPDVVRGACEILGLDPLYIANEGKLIAVVPAEHAAAVLTAMQAHPLGIGAVVIGRVVADHPGTVLMKSPIGAMRILDMLSGEQLPRIC
jgi:hydrogenase expression/formation protein HypE